MYCEWLRIKYDMVWEISDKVQQNTLNLGRWQFGVWENVSQGFELAGAVTF